MSSTADGRVFREEEPTGRFAEEQLDALRARSLEKSTMFTASHPIPIPAAPRPPTPTSPEFLGKSTAVLVLPSEPPPAPAAAPAPAPAPAVASPEPVVARSHRRLSPRVRELVKPRRRVWRQVIKLALLALVVVCQPWWWNVGDLHARPAPPTTTAAK